MLASAQDEQWLRYEKYTFIQKFYRFKNSIFACFLPVCIGIKLDTSARFVPSEYMFCIIVVIYAHREFRHVNNVVLSCSVPVKNNLYDIIPYFQDVGGGTNLIIPYRL